MEIIVSNGPEEIRALVQQGFCPIECAIGDVSIVDALQMDHHGEFSHLEPVAIRAYRDHYGKRAQDPRFIVTGSPDADATFAIASLARIIPANYQPLAETISVIDLDPIGIEILKLPGGKLLLTWNTLMNGTHDHDSLAFYTGVGLWRSLIINERIEPVLDSMAAVEGNRHQQALEDMIECGVEVDIHGQLCSLQGKSQVLLIKDSQCWGFPEWYGRSELRSAWVHPIVLAYSEKDKSVQIGCPNLAVAEKLFGKGGLKKVYPLLEPQGWGGRETVGGSPRGMELTIKQGIMAAMQIAAILKK